MSKSVKDRFQSWMYQQIIQRIMPPHLSPHERTVHFGELSFEAGWNAAFEEMKSPKIPFDFVVSESMPAGEIRFVSDDKEVGRIINIGAQTAHKESDQENG